MQHLGIFLLVFFAWVWLSGPRKSTEAIGAVIVGSALGLGAMLLVGVMS